LVLLELFVQDVEDQPHRFPVNWVPDRLFKKLVALFYLCYIPMLYKMHIIFLILYLGKLHLQGKQDHYVDSVHYIGGRSKANMSWIFLKIPPGISWKFA